MENASEFIKLYNTLDSLLCEKYADYDRNKSSILKYAQELQNSMYNVTYMRGRKLNMIRIIRNTLVHDLDMNKDSLIDIPDGTLAFLKNEINIITNPKKAIDICTPLNKLIVARYNYQVKLMLNIMIKNGNMQAPLLNDKNRLVGVLSPNSIIAYINEVGQLNDDVKVEALANYTPLNKHISEHYEFVARTSLFENVASLFENYYKIGKKLAMVFVTENGKESEAILGVITAYDILNSDNE